MAKNIRLGIKLPSNNQLKAEMQSAIKLMEKHATLDFKIDTKEFSKSLSSMSNELSKLKTQLSKFNILESVQVDSSQVSKAKQEVRELRNELSKITDGNLASTSISSTKNGIITEINKYKDSIAQTTTEVIKNGEVTKQTVAENIAQYEKLKNQLQTNLNKVIGSTFVDKNIINDFQRQIDSLNTNTPQKKFDELKLAIDNVVKSHDTLQKKANNIAKLKDQLQAKLNIAGNNNLVDASVISRLQRQLDSINVNSAEKEINKLKSAISSLSNSDGSIVRLKNSIIKLQERISTIKKNNLDIINTNEIQELKQAENELSKLKAMMDRLKTGEVIDGKAITNQINMATNSVRSLENEFRNVNSAASGLSNTVRNMFSYFLGGSAFYAVMNTMRDAIDTTISLDSAMRDLKRVTSETKDTYSQFLGTANQMAVELGSTTAGVIEATTTFSQLGFDWEKSSEFLNRMSIILSNVGNVSASESASILVSILKGFRLEVEETTKVVDVLNEAG